MAISINPIFPVIAARGAAADAGLQPGQVIAARVQKVLANDLVRIAIANLSIEVMSEVPLQAGQALQLAVSQTADGLRLAVVGRGDTSAPAMEAGARPADRVTLAPQATVDAATTTRAPLPAPRLTALEALAVSAAAQRAVTRQGSLSQLFADLIAAVRPGTLPADVQSAAAQLLARRLPMDASLSGPDLKAALQGSGLFLEKTLASMPAGHAPAAAMPDMKAALIVFRQLLAAHLPAAQGASQAPGTPSSAAPASASPQPDPQLQAPPAMATGKATLGDATLGKATLDMATLGKATLVPELEMREVLLPRARLPAAEDAFGGREIPGGGFRGGMPGSAAATATEARIALSLLQETMAASRDTASPKPASSAGTDEAVTVRTNLPPPPVRGAAPSAQPVAVATVVAEASPDQVVHHLLNDTDAALARQTLLQVASLPDRADATLLRGDGNGPRWNFEIPFATPMGTAIAQFEIARDGGQANEVEAATRVWRARFSLDIEPAGPVHALVSLSGETTSVRMWAERPVTASRLRAEASELSQALSRAELRPGDITVREGAPPQTASAVAGHFLDRAM